MATNAIHHKILQTAAATPYVSASRLKLWLKCPKAYQRRYVNGIITPTSPSLFLGARVHRALEQFYQYRTRGITLYPEYVAECMRKTWSRAAEEECVTFGSAEEEQQLEDQAVNLVMTYLAEVGGNEPPPAALEKRFEAPLIDPTTGEDLGITLVGIIDLVLDYGHGSIICDFKTSARSSTKLDLVHELQLSCYSYLFRQATGQTENALEIRALIKTKTPRVELHRFGPRQERHFVRLFDVIRAYLDAVDHNRFHIRPGIECSFCDFRETCAIAEHTPLALAS